MPKFIRRIIALQHGALAALGLAALLESCGGSTSEAEGSRAPDPSSSSAASSSESAEAPPTEAPRAPILTREERDALAPDDVVRLLQEGNERFVTGELTVREHTAQVRAASLGQYPKASVLSCIDSRVPVEDVFDRGIGDIFVARVAGNFENEDILGSLEFASAVAGARVILVLGHEHCGAVKGAIDGVDMGHLGGMLENLAPAVEHFADYEGERSSDNPELVHLVAEQNVRQTVADIRARSEVLRELEARGELRIVGGMYDMETGRVSLLEED